MPHCYDLGVTGRALSDYDPQCLLQLLGTHNLSRRLNVYATMWPFLLRRNLLFCREVPTMLVKLPVREGPL